MTRQVGEQTSYVRPAAPYGAEESSDAIDDSNNALLHDLFN